MTTDLFAGLHRQLELSRDRLAGALGVGGRLTAYAVLDAERVRAGLAFRRLPAEPLVPGQPDPTAAATRAALAEELLADAPDAARARTAVRQAAAILTDPLVEPAYAAWVFPLAEQEPDVAARAPSDATHTAFVPKRGYEPPVEVTWGWQLSDHTRREFGQALGATTPAKVAAHLAEVLNALHYFGADGEYPIERVQRGYTDGIAQCYVGGSTSQSWSSSFTAGSPHPAKLREIYQLATEFAERWPAESPVNRVSAMKVLREELTSEADVRTATWFDQKLPALWERQAPVWEAAQGGDPASWKTVAVLWLLGGLGLWWLGLVNLVPYGVSRDAAGVALGAICPGFCLLCGMGVVRAGAESFGAGLVKLVDDCVTFFLVGLSPLFVIVPPFFAKTDGGWSAVLDRALAQPAGWVALAIAAAGALQITIGMHILYWWVGRRCARWNAARWHSSTYGW